MENKEQSQLIKRLKSLAWRVGSMTAIYSGSLIIQELNSMEFDSEIKPYINVFTILLGLISGEITKYLNKDNENHWV